MFPMNLRTMLAEVEVHGRVSRARQVDIKGPDELLSFLPFWVVLCKLAHTKITGIKGIPL